MDSTKTTVILSGIAGIATLLLSIFSGRRYRKAKKLLEKVKNSQAEPLAYATELAKQQPYEGIVAGKVISLDRQNVIFRESRAINFRLYNLSTKESLSGRLATGTKLALEEGKDKIYISPNINTHSFGLQREVKYYGPTVLGMNAIAFAVGLLIPIGNFEMNMGSAEYIAFDGQHLTLFGTITYNLAKRTLEMNKVKFIFSGSKKDVEVYLGNIVKREYTGLRLMQGISLGLLGISAYFLIKEVRKRHRIREKEKMMMKVQEKLNKLKMVANIGDGYSCAICFENVKNVIYKNCNHLATCLSCDAKFNSNLCPICRNIITGKVFVVFE